MNIIKIWRDLESSIDPRLEFQFQVEEILFH